MILDLNETEKDRFNLINDLSRDEITKGKREGIIKHFLEDDYKLLLDINRNTVDPFVNKLQERFPDIVTEVSELSPLVYIRCSKEVLFELGYAYSGFPEIEKIYRIINPKSCLTPDSLNETGVNYYKKGNGLRYTGYNVPVAIIEAENGCLDTTDSYYKNYLTKGIKIHIDPISQQNSDPYYAYHARNVVGILRGYDGTISKPGMEMGIAPEAKLWFGSASDSKDIQNTIGRSLKDYPRVMNLSFGVVDTSKPSVFTRYCDDIAYKNRITLFAAVGNEGLDNKYPTDTAVGYNVIGVGNYYLHDTKNIIEMNPNSCWKNPISDNNDREKPDLVAKGDVWVNGCEQPPATSWATPFVSGTSTLLMECNPFLQLVPESVRAILFASAENIEGAKAKSEKDGTGGIRIGEAIRVTKGLDGCGWKIGYFMEGKNISFETKIYLQKGRRTRMAVSWFTDPNYQYASTPPLQGVILQSIILSSYENSPTANIDLFVFNPKNLCVAWSTSSDDTKEVVDFIPQESGYYTLEIRGVRVGKFDTIDVYTGGKKYEVKKVSSPNYSVIYSYAWWQEPHAVIYFGGNLIDKKEIYQKHYLKNDLDIKKKE